MFKGFIYGSILSLAIIVIIYIVDRVIKINYAIVVGVLISIVVFLPIDIFYEQNWKFLKKIT